LRGKSGVRRQHEARRETVAKGEDAQRLGAGGDEGAEQQGEDQDYLEPRR